MYNVIKKELLSLKGKKVLAIIDEGRARKKEVKGIIKDVYNYIFTIELDGYVSSFSFSDILCKTIILKRI